MLKLFSIFIFTLIGLVELGKAQTKVRIDSLEKALKNHKQEDTLKVKILHQLSVEYTYSDLHKSRDFNDKAIALSEKIKFAYGIAQAQLQNAQIYYSQGNYSKALESCLIALRDFQKQNREGNITDAYNLIGLIYSEQKKYPQAEIYLQKAYQLAKKNQDKVLYSIINHLGILYASQKKYEQALEYYNQAIKRDRQVKDSLGLSITLNNIGEVYFSTKKYTEAHQTYREALKISELINDQEGVLYANANLARLYSKTGNLLEAEKLAKLSLQLAEKSKIELITKDIFLTLSEIYEQKQDYKQSLSFYKKYTQNKDSLLNKENLDKIAQLQTMYEFEQKDMENKLLRKEKAESQSLINLQRIILASGAFILLLLGIFSILLYNANMNKKSANQLLETQKNEISKQAEALQLKNIEIEQSHQALEEINQVKDKLFSIIAHDIRGPLNSLQSFLRLVNDSKVDLSEAEIRYLINGISDKVSDTQTLLENLLNWAKKQMQGLELHPQALNLSELINENIQLLQPQAEKKNVMIKNLIDADLKALADADTLRVVLRNLISNAIKFTPENGQVSIEAKKNNENNITVAISDNGVGISSENQSKLFDFRTHYSTYGTANEKGTGLGLLLTKDFVELNGGKIWIESQENLGSTFYFTLSQN
jgi:signal transduction histidine kinase